MVTAVVVDDDYDTVEVFSEFLTLRGIDVIGKAHNGLHGVELFEEKKPDLIFSDIWMPDFDGFYLLSTLKGKHPDSRVIMVTADLTQETERKLKDFNADGVIYKPFKIEHVMNAIESATKMKTQVPNRL